MILVDTNVLMYALGGDHPHKAAAIGLVTRVAAGTETAAINAETLQEILHRYRSLKRWKDGLAAYEMARGVFETVLAITGEVMDIARTIANENENLSARDAVHAAVVAAYRLDGICSFDRDFDRVEGVKRIEPV